MNAIRKQVSGDFIKLMGVWKDAVRINGKINKTNEANKGEGNHKERDRPALEIERA